MNLDDNLFDLIDPDINHLNVLYPDLNTGKESKYYNADAFNELDSNIINSKTNFSLLHQNIRSLHAKHDMFHTFINSFNCKFDVISFTESWLTNATKDLTYFENYNSFHSFRSDGRRGGAISTFVSDKYTCRIIDYCTVNLPYIETLFIEIKHNNTCMIIATVYKPPSSNHDVFINKLNDFITHCNHIKKDNFILCGDFNIDIMNYHNDNNALEFLNTLNSLALLPLISKPTRVTEDTATLIDNIFITNPQNYLSGILISDLSDHLPIFVILQNIISNGGPHKGHNIKYRIVNDVTMQNLYDMLHQYNFNEITNSNDCDHAVKQLSSIIDECYVATCPLKSKTISHKDLTKPWITNEIKSFINPKKLLLFFTHAG